MGPRGTTCINGDPVESTRALFVASRHAFASTPGGQQLCTREYMRTLELGGFKLTALEFAPANHLIQKISRRIDRRPYRHFLPDDLGRRVVREAEEAGASVVFLNTADLAPLAEHIKAVSTRRLTVVLLSHGLESTDYLHELRVNCLHKSALGVHGFGTREFGAAGARAERRIGRLLIEEARQRRHLDGVVTLAAFEAELERWLGASQVMVAPRTIEPRPFAWSPQTGRVGYVGRLDHPPNLEGLELTLRALAARADPSLHIRLAGAPGDLGARFAERYPFVQYLGVVPDAALEVEAQSWAVAVNPVYCYPRGASTKLAIYLGWGLPVVTTTAGTRGYEWASGEIPTADLPDAFAAAVMELAFNAKRRKRAHCAALTATASAPSAEEVGRRLFEFTHRCSEAVGAGPVIADQELRR